MRVLILPRHAAQAASCRHRFLQYLPFLSAHGFECDVSPFFDDRYTAAVLRDGGKQWWRYVPAVFARVESLLRHGRYDLVVIHAELVPFLPDALERLLLRFATPFVLDFDDAFFHSYDRHRLAAVRWLFGEKLPNLMRRAALNSAGSGYLAEQASRFSPRVELVPTVVDLTRYPAVPEAPDRSVFSIGWIGSPATTPHLHGVMRELAEFARGRNVRLVAIGARPFDTGSVPVQWVNWSEATEVANLAMTHVGIMPLPATEWANGKCGFKLIQAMACWKPVIASPVGANMRIVDDGVSGLHAGPGEWQAALSRLYDNPRLCDRMGDAGRQTVEREYSLQVWAPRVAALWAKAAGREFTAAGLITS